MNTGSQAVVNWLDYPSCKGKGTGVNHAGISIVDRENSIFSTSVVSTILKRRVQIMSTDKGFNQQKVLQQGEHVS
jgi:hypothetical protein